MSKPVEEMAKIAAKRDDTCMAASIANDLYNAGYRKASDVAREIFEEIEYHIEASSLCSLDQKELIDLFRLVKLKYTEDTE